MGFMQRYVYKGKFWLVETTAGTECVPFDVCADRDGLAPYVEGNIVDADDDPNIEERDGFYGRYSADGYMDCTDWSWGDNEAALCAYLDNMYGEDDSEPYVET